MTSGEASAKQDAQPSADASIRARLDRQPGGAILWVYNILYWPYLLVSCTVLFFPAVLLWLATFWWDRKLGVLGAYTSLWGAHYLAWAPLAGVTVEGRFRAPRDAPCVYVSNHQSMVDILAVFATRLPFLWVSKVENFYVPFLGWNMWLNRYVALKRGNLRSIRRMLRTCNARLREGESLFVFPEGTRSPGGELGPFFRGAFRIAAKNRVPIVPMVIEGTHGILPKGRFRIVPRHVLVRILDPVDPASVDYDPKRLHDEVRRRMLDEQARIRSRHPER